MDVSQVYRIYLKPAMLPEDKSVNVTIEKVDLIEIHPRPTETKSALLLSFKGKTAKMILNQSNANKLAALGGMDTEAWPGLVISLRRGKWGGKDTIVIGEPVNGSSSK